VLRVNIDMEDVQILVQRTMIQMQVMTTDLVHIVIEICELLVIVTDVDETE
jgi:hypothetical protein